MNENYSMSDYGIFDSAVSTTSKVTESLNTSKTTITECKTNLSNESVFMGPLCDEAVKYKFASVCVNPYYVPLAHELLEDSNVNVCTVIGFPLGQNTTSTKAYEAIEAINNGADEIDMVINIAALKNEDYDYVKEEIEEIRDSIDGKVLKVIIET